MVDNAAAVTAAAAAGSGGATVRVCRQLRCSQDGNGVRESRRRRGLEVVSRLRRWWRASRQRRRRRTRVDKARRLSSPPPTVVCAQRPSSSGSAPHRGARRAHRVRKTPTARANGCSRANAAVGRTGRWDASQVPVGPVASAPARTLPSARHQGRRAVASVYVGWRVPPARRTLQVAPPPNERGALRTFPGTGPRSVRPRSRFKTTSTCCPATARCRWWRVPAGPRTSHDHPKRKQAHHPHRAAPPALPRYTSPVCAYTSPLRTASVCSPGPVASDHRRQGPRAPPHLNEKKDALDAAHTAQAQQAKRRRTRLQRLMPGPAATWGRPPARASRPCRRCFCARAFARSLAVHCGRLAAPPHPRIRQHRAIINSAADAPMPRRVRICRRCCAENRPAAPLALLLLLPPPLLLRCRGARSIARRPAAAACSTTTRPAPCSSLPPPALKRPQSRDARRWARVACCLRRRATEQYIKYRQQVYILATTLPGRARTTAGDLGGGAFAVSADGAAGTRVGA